MGTFLWLSHVFRRLLVLFVFLHTGFLLSAQGNQLANKKVTIVGDNISIGQTFKSIRSQTGLNFMYEARILDTDEKVRAQFIQKSVGEVLNSLLGSKGIMWRIKDNLVLLRKRGEVSISKRSKILDQNADTAISITGRVTDITGTPLPGATVIVLGSRKATTSNEYGEFEINNIESFASLNISYVGYEEQHIALNGSNRITIKLQPVVAEMNAVSVVSTGYQKIPRERATGSFTQIDNKLYNQQVGTNVLDRLTYITNGLSTLPQRVASSGGGILIRGLSTGSTDNSINGPLIVVDNFPYSGNINNINPNDVESITVLKDAASASIWGAKAGNGVIVITTKKGRFNQPTKVEISSNITVADKPDIFYAKSISASDFIDVERELFDQGYYDGMIPYPEYYPLSDVVNILAKQRAGAIPSEQAKMQINSLRNNDVRNDFAKFFYRKEVNQQYNVNVRGGTNNLSWILSAGFDKNISVLAAGYNRLNVRFDNTYKVAKNFEISTGVYYTQSKSIGGRPSYGSIPRITPYTQFADDKGHSVPFYQYGRALIDTIGGGRLLDWKYYPRDDYMHIDNTNRIRDLTATIGLNYKLTNSLSIDVKYQYERQQTDERTLYDHDSYFTRDLINNYSQIDYSTGIITYKIPKGDILDLRNGTLASHNIRGQINYNVSWNKGEINAIAGADIRDVATEGNTYRTYGYNAGTLAFQNVDYANTYPLLIGGYSTFIPNPAAFDKGVLRFVSLYANAAYTYNGKYTFSASARRDASNIFGVRANERWKPLWSTGMSWNISEENFYKSTLIPYLKIRATYGYSGNVDPRKVAVTTIVYREINNPYTLLPYARYDNFYNPDLKWEQVGMLNLGLDFGTSGNIVSGSVEYFRKKMTDLYGDAPVDVTAGLGQSTIVKNVGSMKGQGFDIAINTVNIDRKIKWTTNLIINIYKDKFGKSDVEFPTNFVVGDGPRSIEGYPFRSYFAYKWGGLDPATGDPRGYLDGKLSKDYEAITGTGTKFSDLVYIGPILPTTQGSLANTISWNNLSLTTRITFKLGYYFRRESINYSRLVETSQGHSDFVERWRKPGDEAFTNVPSLTYPLNSLRDLFYTNSEVLATKGDHFRLQNIRLSYDLSKNNFRRLPVDNLQIYAMLNNVGIIWRANKEGLDPDYSDYSIPNPKSIAIGLNIGF